MISNFMKLSEGMQNRWILFVRDFEKNFGENFRNGETNQVTVTKQGAASSKERKAGESGKFSLFVKLHWESIDLIFEVSLKLDS